MTTLDAQLWRAAQTLAREVDALRVRAPVTHVYNPLRYAAAPHREYLRRYAASKKRMMFLGMNPGPYGMAQTGVPFGEVGQVRDWLGICAPVGGPERVHPKRPIEGFACKRSEVSGARLWGALASVTARAERFFAERFVANYCPLVFMEQSGKNRTPDSCAPDERAALYAACDRHLADAGARVRAGVGDRCRQVRRAARAQRRWPARAYGSEPSCIRRPRVRANRGWASKPTSSSRAGVEAVAINVLRSKKNFTARAATRRRTTRN